MLLCETYDIEVLVYISRSNKVIFISKVTVFLNVDTICPEMFTLNQCLDDNIVISVSCVITEFKPIPIIRSLRATSI